LIGPKSPNHSAYIFLAEDCKICQSHTFTLKKLSENYENESGATTRREHLKSEAELALEHCA